MRHNFSAFFHLNRQTAKFQREKNLQAAESAAHDKPVVLAGRRPATNLPFN
jgi:hypothetical protein